MRVQCNRQASQKSGVALFSSNLSEAWQERAIESSISSVQPSGNLSSNNDCEKTIRVVVSNQSRKNEEHSTEVVRGGEGNVLVNSDEVNIDILAPLSLNFLLSHQLLEDIALQSDIDSESLESEFSPCLIKFGLFFVRLRSRDEIWEMWPFSTKKKREARHVTSLISDYDNRVKRQVDRIRKVEDEIDEKKDALRDKIRALHSVGEFVLGSEAEIEMKQEFVMHRTRLNRSLAREVRKQRVFTEIFEELQDEDRLSSLKRGASYQKKNLGAFIHHLEQEADRNSFDSIHEVGRMSGMMAFDYVDDLKPTEEQVVAEEYADLVSEVTQHAAPRQSEESSNELESDDLEARLARLKGC